LKNIGVMKLYNNALCGIEYFETIPCLSWKLLGSPSNEEFKEFVLKGVAYFNKFKIENKGLSLIINIYGFSPENDKEIDIDWVNREIMTLLFLNNGIQLIALIPSQSDKAKRIEMEFFEKNEQLHRVKIADSFTDSVEWLREGAKLSDGFGSSYYLF